MKIVSTKGLLVVVLALVIVAAGWTALNSSSAVGSTGDGGSNCWACPSAGAPDAGAGRTADVAESKQDCKGNCDECTGECKDCGGNCDACEAEPAGCPVANEATCAAQAACPSADVCADASKPCVNQEKCIGCGICARKAPDAFEMNAETGKAQVKPGAPAASVAKGAKACPTKAIEQ